MSQAELYRSYAQACFRAAQGTANQAERGRWLGMAEHWLHWAQEEEAGRLPWRPVPASWQPQQQQEPQPTKDASDPEPA